MPPLRNDVCTRCGRNWWDCHCGSTLEWDGEDPLPEEEDTVEDDEDELEEEEDD